MQIAKALFFSKKPAPGVGWGGVGDEIGWDNAEGVPALEIG